MLLRSTKCAGAGTDSSRNFTAPNRFLHAGTARSRTARSNRMAGGRAEATAPGKHDDHEELDGS